MDMARVLVGVMGPGEAALPKDCRNAYEMGRAIATNSWVLVTGGRDVGVMDAASRGAREAGGLTVGVLPSSDLASVSTFVDIPIVTGLGEARNNVNVLTCELIFACGMNAGTASEICLALKADRHVIFRITRFIQDARSRRCKPGNSDRQGTLGECDTMN